MVKTFLSKCAFFLIVFVTSVISKDYFVVSESSNSTSKKCTLKHPCSFQYAFSLYHEDSTFKFFSGEYDFSDIYKISVDHNVVLEAFQTGVIFCSNNNYYSSSVFLINERVSFEINGINFKNFLRGIVRVDSYKMNDILMNGVTFQEVLSFFGMTSFPVRMNKIQMKDCTVIESENFLSSGFIHSLNDLVIINCSFMNCKSSCLEFQSENAKFLTINGNKFDQTQHVATLLFEELESFHFESNSISNCEGLMINVSISGSVNDITFADIFFEFKSQKNNCIEVAVSDTVGLFNVSACSFQNCKNAVEIGVKHLQTLNMENSFFTGNDYCFRSRSLINNVFDQVLIQGCLVEKSDHGFWFDSIECKEFFVENCRFMNQTSSGLFVTGLLDNVEITSSEFLFSNNPLTVYSDDFSVFNCIFESCYSFNNSPFSYYSSILSKSNFILFKNVFNNNTGINGGGIFVKGWVNANISNSNFTNLKGESGGGLFISSSGENELDFLVFSCLFSNNHAKNGGGIYVSEGSKVNLFILNSKFVNNSAKEVGGAFYIIFYYLNIFNSVFIDNSAKNGCLYVNSFQSTSVLFFSNNSLISNNGNTSFLINSKKSKISFLNNIITNNSVKYLVYASGTSQTCVFQNNVWKNNSVTNGVFIQNRIEDSFFNQIVFYNDSVTSSSLLSFYWIENFHSALFLSCSFIERKNMLGFLMRVDFLSFNNSVFLSGDLAFSEINELHFSYCSFQNTKMKIESQFSYFKNIEIVGLDSFIIKGKYLGFDNCSIFNASLDFNDILEVNATNSGFQELYLFANNPDLQLSIINSSILFGKGIELQNFRNFFADDLTINGTSKEYGGGILLNFEYGCKKVILINSRIQSCSSKYGGGIFFNGHNEDSYVYSKKSTISHNKALYGGGIFYNLTNLDVENIHFVSDITKNVAKYQGGGVYGNYNQKIEFLEFLGKSYENFAENGNDFMFNPRFFDLFQNNIVCNSTNDFFPMRFNCKVTVNITDVAGEIINTLDTLFPFRFEIFFNNTIIIQKRIKFLKEENYWEVVFSPVVEKKFYSARMNMSLLVKRIEVERRVVEFTFFGKITKRNNVVVILIISILSILCVSFFFVVTVVLILVCSLDCIKTEKGDVYPPKELTNLSFTCYMNSLLQVLFNCDDFVEFIRKNKFIEPLKLILSINNSKDQRPYDELIELADFLSRKNIITKNGFYYKYSHPFDFFLNLKFYLENLGNKKCDVAEELSFMVVSFKCKRSCSKCNVENVIAEKMVDRFDFELKKFENKSETLKFNSILDSWKEEKHNSKCECGSTEETRRKFDISYPKYALINITRGKSKILMEIPQNFETDDVSYTISGVSYLIGSDHSIAYIKKELYEKEVGLINVNENQKVAKWFECNDEIITEISPNNDFLMENEEKRAQILLYRKTDVSKKNTKVFKKHQYIEIK